MHAVEPGIDALRAAFAKGVSARSSALLLQARDEGLEYESVTRAVARIASAVAIYAALRPVFGLGHELVVAGLAWLFRAAVGTGFWEPLIRWLGLDPIYTGAAIRAAGGVQVAGFAVAAPPGDALHAALPTLFLGPRSARRGSRHQHGRKRRRARHWTRSGRLRCGRRLARVWPVVILGMAANEVASGRDRAFDTGANRD